MKTKKKMLISKGIAGLIALGLLTGMGWAEKKPSAIEREARACFERVKKDYKEGMEAISKELEEKDKQGVFERKDKKGEIDFTSRSKYIETEHYKKKYDLAFKTAKEYARIAETYPKSKIADLSLFEAIKVLENLKMSDFITKEQGKEIQSQTTRYANILIDKYPETEIAKFEKIKINKEGLKAEEMIKRYEALTNKYPKSEVADDCLFEIINLLIQTRSYPKGEVLDENYKRAMKYAERLYKDYPKSELGEWVYFSIGLNWCGLGCSDFSPGEYPEKYIDAYVEVVKRYPESKYAPTSLQLIMIVSRHEKPHLTLWAYKTLIVEYKDKPFFCFAGGDIYYYSPEQRYYIEKHYGEGILYDCAWIIKSALYDYKYNTKEEYYPKGKITNGNELYKILKPYLEEQDERWKDFNPFSDEYGLKLIYYESNGQKFKFKLELFGLTEEVESE
ncbi:MAG: hypothetical protein AB1397_02190 [bacterium]